MSAIKDTLARKFGVPATEIPNLKAVQEVRPPSPHEKSVFFQRERRGTLDPQKLRVFDERPLEKDHDFKRIIAAQI